MKALHKSLAAAAICAFALHGNAAAQAQNAESAPYKPTVGQSGKDVVWVPTPQALVDRMLDMAALTPQDRLVDLGSGDGRTVITAAQRGATARGIEFNPDMVALARQAAQAAGVADRAKFEQADIFESDFSEATVITLFLLPDLNVKLRPILLDMPPGTRIVSNSFTMDDWEPDETAQAGGECSAYCSAYKWVVPAKVAGTWQLSGKELVLEQTYQKLAGSLQDGGKATPISDAWLNGDQIQFMVGTQRYTGQVSDKTMQGTIDGNGTWSATRS
ncbi:cyclopropane-fatty-acyl-phospholipid synthase family protein [Bordetella sp. BOR01]|uniref:SAM-dependent methyltransferase n=1 Tax=Bordetella sp. BOR01 TaxID=2854779 RepID=UPI001C45D243|nr:methyltransferase domain-containing protein [Bordetella sp. BOR01]MBV7484880.1 methyltransferase domain-containing protein [Bordetella sp. BOR01]